MSEPLSSDDKTPISGSVSDSTKFDTELNDERTPKDVLRDIMLFYDGKGKLIANEIIKLLKNGKTDAITLTEMYKAAVNASKLATDAATRLAPYVHARLESVSVKQEVEHRFVIVAPSRAANTQEWMESVKQSQAPQIELSKKDVVEINTDTGVNINTPPISQRVN